VTHRTWCMKVLGLVLTLGFSVTPGLIALAAEMGPGEGLVVFQRKDVMKGKAIQFNLRQDGNPIGQLKAGTTIQVSLEPGSYNFTVRAPSLDGEDFMTINIEAGWTYQVEGIIKWGWPTGRPKFKMLSSTPGAGDSSAGAGTTAATAPAAVAGPALGSIVAQPAESAQAEPGSEENGKIGMLNFVGEWDLEVWSLARDGSKLDGRGTATGTLVDGSATRIDITEFSAAAFPAATGGGRIEISHVPGEGFRLESEFKHFGELLVFPGQYDVPTGRYIFHLSGGVGGVTATGTRRSAVRVEVRSLDFETWIAEAYSSVDGQSIQIQSYRFSRR
jgi:hypothetical protein